MALPFLAAGLSIHRPAVAGRISQPVIEIRESGHDPAARWDAAGVLNMIFVRDDPGGPRLYYTRSGSRPAAPTAVSPAGLSVVAHPQTGPSLEILPDGSMVAIYSVSLPARHGSAIRAQRSTDGGVSWSAPAAVNDDATDGPHGWISTAIDASGRIHVAWLDKRSGEQGVAWTRTGDGAHFEPNRVLDPRVCFCCSTALAAGPDGRVWIAYRDLEGKDLRNIAVLAGDRNGRFGSPRVVSDDGWRIDGCPDSGPRVALAPEGGIWAIWFNGAAPGIFAAFSPGGGVFSRPLQVAGAASDGAVPNHPDIAVLPDKSIVALYVIRSTIFGRVLNRDGKTWQDAVRLVEGAAEPRITAAKGRYALSYTSHQGSELLAVAETKSLGALPSPSR